MPTPLKHSKNMRKHLTKAERDAREAAEAGMEHGRVRLPPPAWLGVEARKVFENTKRRLRQYELLETVDIDMLAMYADAVVRYQTGVKTLNPSSTARDIQAVQAWSRIALTYADKLGFSQTARARLARRKAIEPAPDPMEALLNDVSLFLNPPGEES